MIHLGSLNLGQSERQDLIKFQYPLEKEIVLLDARLANTGKILIVALHSNNSYCARVLGRRHRHCNSCVSL